MSSIENISDILRLEEPEALANHLLNYTNLVICGEPHRLIEIELYKHSCNHTDNFTHKFHLQKSFGHFYFHRLKSGINSPLREGTYKGLDITFGSDDIYASMLIRSIQTPDGDIIQGPCRCVNHILHTYFDLDSVTEFLNQNPDIELKSFLTDDGSFPADKLTLEFADRSKAGRVIITNQVQIKSNKIYRVWCSPRVGLSLKRKIPSGIRYIMRPYRFTLFPRLKVNKTMVFLGMMYYHNIPLDDARALTGTTVKQANKAITLFEEGQDLPTKLFKGKVLKADDKYRLYGSYIHNILN